MEPAGAQAAYSSDSDNSEYDNFTNFNDYRQSHAAHESPTSVSTRPIVTPHLVHIDLSDERIQDVLARITQVIKDEYPAAEFLSYIGTDPLGVHIEVYTPTQEFSGILNLLDDRLGNLHIAAGVSICLVPKRTVHTAAA